MATKIYDTAEISLIDGAVFEAKPLKLRYLRLFMDEFSRLQDCKDDDSAIAVLVDCALICMRQFLPTISTREELEDVFDLPTIYRVLDFAAGIKINADREEVPVKKQAEDSEGSNWADIDLLKLESEVFSIGAWKNYEDLEDSVSMPELLATLSSKRELDYLEKKFLAAIQGVDLDGEKDKAQNKWEQMKAKVFSGGASSDPDDVLSLQGVNAAKAGFGIGMGLSYEKI